MSRSSSPEPDFLCPNGFQDVADDNVQLSLFSKRQHSEELEQSLSFDNEEPTKKRKTRSQAKSPRKRRKATYSEISNSPVTVASAVITDHEESYPNISLDKEAEDVINLDEVSTPSPPETSFYDAVTLSDDEDVYETLPTDEDNVNPKMTIRVIWRGKVHPFQIRKRIQEIYTFFANLENVPENNILLETKEGEASQNDTPDSLKTSFLDGRVCNASEMLQRNAQVGAVDPNALELKVQQKGVKEKLSIYISRKDSMKVLVSKLAEDLNVSASKIRLTFDGDVLDPSDTPETLDLEGGECLDLVIKS